MAWLEQRFAMHSFTCAAGTLHWARRRHFARRQKVAKAVMAGARANKLQLAVTLRGASGATGLRRPHQSKPLGTGGLAARCHGTKGELLAQRFMNSSAAAMKEVPPQYSSGQSAR